MALANSKGMTPTGRKAKVNSFAGIPRWLMETDDFIKLSASAVRLLLELSYQYRGANNGDLTLAWHVLKNRGWKSRTTIEKARDALLDADLIICTREGRFLNPGGVCALYAIRWRPINESSKYDLNEIPESKRRARSG